MKTTIFAFALLLVACSKDATKDAPPATKNASASATAAASGTTNAAPVTPSAVTAPAGSALAADGTGTLSLSWKVANAGTDEVAVTLVAGDVTIPVGKLASASDDPGPTLETCSMRNAGTTESRLSCGASPHYNWYTAKISGGQLVVTLTDGVDPHQDPDTKETVTEVLRRPTNATALKASGPASKALYGECRAGYVQKKAGAPCMKQCLKGSCKANEKCELTAVEGTDGPHKVSACVPK